MKGLIITFLILFTSKVLSAQTDTSAYTIQRDKIRELLNERSERFGQYDNSLTRRSGIFGLKTKRDMQASNDILTQIVLNDNRIFNELKVLLDYKEFERKELEGRAETVEGRIDRFQSTITRFQQQNENLKAEIEELENRNDRLLIFLILFAAFTLIMLTFSPVRPMVVSVIKKLLRIDRRNGKE
jgi:peptidoglycan hydrolase CwlO-like protein